MPTEQYSFFCASNYIPLCNHQCSMCERKEQEMKMAKEQPLFVMIITFNDRKPQFITHSNTEEALVEEATNRLREDSSVSHTYIYKPISKIERSEIKITRFD